MDLNRNQFLFIAIFLLLLGMQLRMVGSYVLNGDATRFLAQRAMASDPGATAGKASQLPDNLPAKVVSPPDWVGWCLLSVGAVLFFHSMTMSKPGGG